MPRITIAYSNRRKLLEPVRRSQEEEFPKANVKMAGGPGYWKVRRDLLPDEDAPKARNMTRGL